MADEPVPPPPGGERSQLELNLNETIRLLQKQARLYDSDFDLEKDDDNSDFPGTNAWLLEFTIPKLQTDVDESTWKDWRRDDNTKLNEIFADAAEEERMDLTKRAMSKKGLNADQQRRVVDIISVTPTYYSAHNLASSIHSAVLISEDRWSVMPELILALSKSLAQASSRRHALELLDEAIAAAEGKEEGEGEEIEEKEETGGVEDGAANEEDKGAVTEERRGPENEEAKVEAKGEGQEEAKEEAKEAAQDKAQGAVQEAAQKQEAQEEAHQEAREDGKGNANGTANGTANEATKQEAEKEAKNPPPPPNAPPPCPLPLLRDMLAAAAEHTSFIESELARYKLPNDHARPSAASRYERAIELSREINPGDDGDLDVVELRVKCAQCYGVQGQTADKLRQVDVVVKALPAVETEGDLDRGRRVRVVVDAVAGVLKGEVKGDEVGELAEGIRRRFREWCEERWPGQGQGEGPDRKRQKL